MKTDLTLDQVHAVMVYAGQKLLEQTHAMDENKCDVEPGTSHDITGLEITLKMGDNQITIAPPPGTVCKREVGDNGDGTTNKHMPQKLFGTTILAECIYVLRKFRQSDRLIKLFFKAVKRSIAQSNTTEKALKEQAAERLGEDQAQAYLDELNTIVEFIRNSCPEQPNAMPRRILPPKRGLKPTVIVH